MMFKRLLGMTSIVTGQWWFYPALIGGLLIGFFWWMRVHDNRIREQEKPEIRKEVLKEMTEQHEKDFAPELKEIKDNQALAIKALSDQILQIQQVSAAKVADRAALNQTINALSGAIARIPAQVATIPAGKLPDEIRHVLAELRQ